MKLCNENIILNIYLAQKCSRNCFKSWGMQCEEKSDMVPTCMKPSGRMTLIKHTNTKWQTVIHGVKGAKRNIMWDIPETSPEEMTLN